MQRIRVGLTGLACVFLLVMLATAFLRMADGSGGTGSASTPANVAAPAEPLAQLGVVPGNPATLDPPAVQPAPAASPRPAAAAPAR